MNDVNLNMDFNLEEDVVADPLIPQGTYHGSVTNVSYDNERNSIVWQLTLADNGGVMNDGETPVDGATVFARNWLPNPGDENTPTPSGKTNKRQAKINMLSDFADKLNINMNTPTAIMEGINEAQWVGLEVLITLEIREWEGKFSNDVKRVAAVE
jgi:hypothetical protein